MPGTGTGTNTRIPLGKNKALKGNGDADDGYNPYTTRRDHLKAATIAADIATDIADAALQVYDVHSTGRLTRLKKADSSAVKDLAKLRGTSTDNVERALRRLEASRLDREDNGTAEKWAHIPLLNDVELDEYRLKGPDLKRLSEIGRIRKETAAVRQRNQDFYSSPAYWAGRTILSVPRQLRSLTN